MKIFLFRPDHGHLKQRRRLVLANLISAAVFVDVGRVIMLEKYA
jgi:hypothetical protein